MPEKPEKKDATLLFARNKPASAAGSIALLIAPGTARERAVTIGAEPATVGKGDGADIRVDDPHVSRLHAELRATVDGLHVRDLDSRNGTFVNGVLVKDAVVASGAMLALGTTAVLVGGGAAPAAAPAGVAAEASFGGAVGASGAMRAVFALLAKLAPTDLGITLIGETGVGKDVLARAIHERSPRASAPLSVFDCGAVAPNLIESELFGHDKGAFTGAVADRQGAFERAHRGTLFLDEVAELPLDLQPRLLRALEQGSVRRLGANSPLSVDVRVIAATNRDLEEEVAAGRFRRDLFFRLSTAVVRIPPLRARLDDLPLLVAASLAEIGSPLSVADSTLAALASYDWPGNVRELKNVIASAAAFVDGDVLEPRHLMFFKPRGRQPTLDRLPLAGRALDALERAAIKQTLERESGNKTRTARALGIASSTLYEKLKKYRLS